MATERKATWAGFVVWALVGGLFGFASVSFIVIAFIPAIVILILAITRKNLVPSGWGALAGLGVVPLLVAYIQRRGPGTVCVQTATETSCQDYLNPWPWLIAGVVMVAFGVGGQFIRMQRDRHATAPARNSDLR